MMPRPDSQDPCFGDRRLLGLRLVRASTEELRRLRVVRGAYKRTARRVRAATVALALGASLLGIVLPARSAAKTPWFFSGLGEYQGRAAFVDIDGDGDLDGFVGDGSGRLAFFANVGDVHAPIFDDPVVSPFGLTDVGSAAVPVFVDIDGDGDADAFVGNGAGDTVFFGNTGSASSPSFDAPVTNPFGLADVGGHADPTFADVDQDGDLDALIGNSAGETVYFRNSGTASAPAFKLPETNPFGLVSVSSDAVPTFVDIDDDGDLDALVGEGFGDVVFFENSRAAGLPSFLPPRTNPFGLVHLQSNAPASVPTFVDIDGDGDLDVINRGNGHHIVDRLLLFGNTGNAAFPAFDSQTPTDPTPFGLGDFFYESVLTFGDIDGDGDLDAFTGEYEGRTFFFVNAGTPTQPRFGSGNPFGIGAHAYHSAVATVDIDGDGDLDVFLGGLFSDDTLFYENTGSDTAPALAAPVANPFGLTPLGTYIAPSFADIDGDGDPDALFGDDGGRIVLFANSGSATSPSFGAPQVNPFGLSDVGTQAKPIFVDIDADGDLDAIVGRVSGSVVFFTNTGTSTAPAFQVAPIGLPGGAPAVADIDADGDLDAFLTDGGDTSFFENTGTAASPAFAPAQVNPFGILNRGLHASPHLADIDGDGDFDLFVGAEYGVVEFFENVGSSASPTFSLGTHDSFLVPSVYAYASPTLADIDGDGDLDAFVGDAYGHTVFFENTGSPASPTFAAGQTNPFGLASVGDWPRPSFADIDGDGDLDAFVGKNDGNTFFFENQGTSTAPLFAAAQTNPFGLTAVYYLAAPTFVDIDDDGDLDAFVGQEAVGIPYFENTGTATTPAFAAPEIDPFGLGPIVYKHATPNFVDIDGDGDLDFLSGAYFGETVFSRNGISGGPGTGVEPFMEYKVKESDRRAENGILTPDCHVMLDDPIFDFGNGRSSVEDYRASLVRSLGLPADVDGAGETDFGATHLLGLLIRGSNKGAEPLVLGKFQPTRKHKRRTGVLVTIPDPTLYDGSGANTIRLDTKKVTRLLVPAAKSLVGPPAAPGPLDPTDHYECYKVKASASGGVGTLQDASGRELRGIQVVVEDQFADGAGHPEYGDARRFDLLKVTELCNPVGFANVDMTEQDAQGNTRTTSCLVTPREIERHNTSLLCWRTKLAKVAVPQPWEGGGSPVPIDPRQQKHEKRKLKTGNPVYVGHGLVAPDRVDTSREIQLCLPAAVADRGTIKN